MADQYVTSFAVLLKQLRTGARMTQEELSRESGIHKRTISDLERGIAVRPQRDTAQLLADALGLDGPRRDEFEAVARWGFQPGQSAKAGARTSMAGRRSAAIPRRG
jgi:transcriptional regulator with XRE-family HTH domain